MRAMVLHRPAPADANPLALEVRPVPEPGPGELSLRVLACGVCRTDLQLCEGDLGTRRLPLIPGHQVVGVAPVGSVMPAALRALDRGGVVAIIAIHLDRVPELPYADLWWERSIRSVASVTRTPSCIRSRTRTSRWRAWPPARLPGRLCSRWHQGPIREGLVDLGHALAAR
jgi:D-arabinose 1-dehydrogenase-like Zn-dependent alcohol dehydrogenase